jgi:hypothetical protein
LIRGAGKSARATLPSVWLFNFERAQHGLLMEQDCYRAQFWAAFGAFAAGTPLS